MNKTSPPKSSKKPAPAEKPVPRYRNPFLNFLADFRKKNPGVGGAQMMQKAAEAWRQMSEADKAPYVEMARKAPRRRRRRPTRRQRARSRSVSSHSSVSQSSN